MIEANDKCVILYSKAALLMGTYKKRRASSTSTPGGVCRVLIIKMRSCTDFVEMEKLFNMMSNQIGTTDIRLSDEESLYAQFLVELWAHSDFSSSFSEVVEMITQNLMLETD